LNSTATGARSGRELFEATRPFVEESTARSWWHVGSTFTLMIAALTGAAVLPWWPLRLLLSLLGSLVMVRTFITFHDYQHGAILRESRLASWLFGVYGCFALTPANSWNRSHNHHHRHVGQLSTEGVGAFPLITVRMWRKATRGQRAQYRATRHPLIILFGYVTVFFFSVSLEPLLREPRRHWDSAFALLIHGGIAAGLWWLGGFDAAFFGLLLPMAISSVLGGYLFFAQHSFESMVILAPAKWNAYEAAVESSSYLRTNAIMQWFTGNIGFHHVHHLNVRIPFYRLPEAMAAIPELQSPHATSLKPSDIIACFRASLWCEDRQRMVSYREADAIA
jgi:acyl-lipid omega-6 desaturase (Delta-12 desaturase)